MFPDEPRISTPVDTFPDTTFRLAGDAPPIVLPLVKPTLAAIAIFTFMGVWNDFMGPLIYLTDQRLYPISLGLFALNVEAAGLGASSMGIMMAGSLLMTVPVVVIFFFAQKYFIQGVTLTGMKG